MSTRLFIPKGLSPEELDEWFEQQAEEAVIEREAKRLEKAERERFGEVRSTKKQRHTYVRQCLESVS